MAGTPADDDAVLRLLRELTESQGKGIPQGGVRRTLRTARAAIGTGVSFISGRWRDRDATGLAAADLQAIERLVRNLGELKGLAMKAGQILSYIDESLPPEYRSMLGTLQTRSEPVPFPVIADTIREDLGTTAQELLAGMDHRPVSVASIGQVHRGRLPDGTEVAIKILHPGISRALESDFRMAAIGPAFTRLLVPAGAASVKEFIGEARDRLLEECDYGLEARRQKRFGELNLDNPHVVIPKVQESWCGPRVLVTTWEDGISLDEFLGQDPPAATRDMFGETLFLFYFRSLYVHGIFHADPHPGNYAFRQDGSLVLYDFGCVREFDRDTVHALASLLRAVRADDEAAIRESFAAFGARPPDRADDYERLRSLLRGFFGPLLVPGRHPMDARVRIDASEIMRDKMAMARMSLPGKLLFLFRIRFGLYSVLARLGSNCDWHALEDRMLREAGLET